MRIGPARWDNRQISDVTGGYTKEGPTLSTAWRTLNNEASKEDMRDSDEFDKRLAGNESAIGGPMEASNKNTTAKHVDLEDALDQDKVYATYPLLESVSFVETDLPDIKCTHPSLDRDIDEIRLIKILPGRRLEDISCEIFTYPLAQAPQYRALSYTWGRADPDCKIFLNEKSFCVRKNLWRFFEHVHKLPRFRDNLFWIDAVCIDQSNTSERTHQVGLMSRIFSGATEVVVWLGPAYGNSDPAMKYLKDASTCKPSRDTSKLWWRSEASAIRDLCERSYWTRLWVVQELVLASRIVLLCGSRILEWEAFERFVANTQMGLVSCRREDSMAHASTIKSRAFSMMKQVLSARQDSSLVEQMEASKDLGCLDPLDKVYALLGVVKSGHEAIVPDYSMDISSVLNAVMRNNPTFRGLASLAAVKSYCEWFAAIAAVSLSTLLSPDQASLHTIQASRKDLLLYPLVEKESGLSLWWAISHHHWEVVKMWVEADGWRETFKLASRQQNLAVCQFLLLTLAYHKNFYTGFAFALSYAMEFDLDAVLGLAICILPAMSDKTPSEVNLYEPVHLSDSFEEAIPRSHTEILEILFAYAGYRIPKAFVSEALYNATMETCVRGVRLALKLLSRGSHDSCLAYNSHISLSLEHAIKFQDEEILDMLECHVLSKFDYNSITFDSALKSAASRGSDAAVGAFLERYDQETAGVKANQNGIMALYAAGCANQQSTVKLLLSRTGIDINVPYDRYVEKRTPLMLAAHYGYVGIVSLLLSRSDLSINIQYGQEPSALGMALRVYHAAVVRLLLADPRTEPNDEEESVLREWYREGRLRSKDMPEMLRKTLTRRRRVLTRLRII